MTQADSPAEPLSVPVATVRLLVAVGGHTDLVLLVRTASRIASAFGAEWEAVHIETPGVSDIGSGDEAVAEALALAARLGATIAAIPAASVADGLIAHLEGSPASHVVIGGSAGRRGRWRRISLAERLARGDAPPTLHLLPPSASSSAAERAPRPAVPGEHPPASAYGIAALAVLATLLVAEILQVFLGTRPLDLLFLLPVIAVAARLGIGPALLAVALSVVSYNFFLLAPALSFNPMAPQNLVMSGVLAGAAFYTGLLTARMRGRLLLSDRSARENASVAALAQKLTRDSDWETTAQTVCEHVHGLLRLHTVVFREVEGQLRAAGALPEVSALGPVDQAALDWCWEHGEEAGAGTQILSAANWQFQPLKTSLGVLAILGLARDDGRDPVRADQRVLLHTLVAQAALAHERLRLEDRMRATAH